MCVTESIMEYVVIWCVYKLDMTA